VSDPTPAGRWVGLNLKKYEKVFKISFKRNFRSSDLGLDFFLFVYYLLFSSGLAFKIKFYG